MNNSDHDGAAGYTTASFYAVGHLDDWQLFINPDVSHDLADAATKVVIIHTTGDEAGAGEQFWKAKEAAVIASIRFRLSSLRPVDEIRGAVEMNGHSIERWAGANAVAYFLRLPDGNMHGTGFETYGWQSLHKLRTGEIAAASTVDGSTEYRGWDDLATTLQAIVDHESAGIAAIRIGHHDTDERRNPGDHSDHRTTALAMESMPNYRLYRRRAYVGYNQADPQDLSGEELFWKVAQFAAYDKVVFDQAQHSTIGEKPDLYIGWCMRAPQARDI